MLTFKIDSHIFDTNQLFASKFQCRKYPQTYFFTLFFFSGSTRIPQFMNDEMQNHTVRVGSEATFSCTVEHLNTYKVAWLHSEKGTLAVYPTVISHNNRISVRHDNRHAYYLHLRDIQESDAGKYICQLNTDPAISVRGSLNVVGKTLFFILTCMFIVL